MECEEQRGGTGDYSLNYPQQQSQNSEQEQYYTIWLNSHNHYYNQQQQQQQQQQIYASPTHYSQNESGENQYNNAPTSQHQQFQLQLQNFNSHQGQNFQQYSPIRAHCADRQRRLQAFYYNEAGKNLVKTSI